MEDTQRSMNIIVVMPAYNVSKTLAETVKAAASVPDVSSIIVVDDGSADDTAQVASRLDVELVSHESNKGKGAALQTGVNKALEMGADAVVLLDSDLGSCVTEISRLIQPIKNRETDMTIARFTGSGGGGFGIVKRISQTILRTFTHQEFQSPLSGQRGLTVELARKIRFRKGWGAEVGLTLDAHRAGFKVAEVPVAMSQQGTGRNLKGFKHRGKQLIGILRTTLEVLAGR